MAGKTVFLDASVLYPAPLRDLLMNIALAGLFRPKWSEEIHAEWIDAVLRQRPDLNRGQLERTRALMNLAAPDAMTQDYADEATNVGPLPDPDDVHVVAAAIKAEAEEVLTFNLKDFPDHALQVHGLRAVHPDAFLCELLELAPEEMAAAVAAHRASLKRPARTAAEYLTTLHEQRLTRFADALVALKKEF